MKLIDEPGYSVSVPSLLGLSIEERKLKFEADYGLKNYRKLPPYKKLEEQIR
jgi:hypothetical protein